MKTRVAGSKKVARRYHNLRGVFLAASEEKVTNKNGLINSEGWRAKFPIWIHLKAPRLCSPNTNGANKKIIEMANIGR
jgi:hypothetical protein